jgi:polyisoprenoid-binding protein YceI
MATDELKEAPMTTDSTTKPLVRESIAQGRWRIDPERSRVEFRTPTLWGRATVKGHFERYEGTLDLEHDPAIELTIDATSVETGLAVRDKHLRSADFFDAANHPQVSFVSDDATLEGERLHVRGRLAAGGKTIPLELDGSLRRIGEELELNATTTADHRKLGMSHGLLGMIPTPSELIVHGRLVS